MIMLFSCFICSGRMAIVYRTSGSERVYFLITLKKEFQCGINAQHMPFFEKCDRSLIKAIMTYVSNVVSTHKERLIIIFIN